MAKTIFAAGTVCWRVTKKDGIKVLLIRRIKHRDWSFPKGKVDKGEALPTAAVRETLEETGLAVKLGASLGTINYRVDQERDKIVQYWAAKVQRKKAKKHKFVPNDEVYKIKWVSPEKAAELLTYPADRELFQVFINLVNDNSHDTFSLTILRHAKAESLGDSIKIDHERPLSKLGVKQAETISTTLEAFGAKKIYSSTARRCLETVSPLAKLTGAEIYPEEGISQRTWDQGETRELRDLVERVVAAKRSAVFCSHLPVLPDLTREIAACTLTPPGRYLNNTVDLPPGAFSVFHIAKKNSDRGIVAVETFPLKL